MTWLRKSPFKRNEDPVEHMIELLSQQAAHEGTPLTAAEKELLSRDLSGPEGRPEEFRHRMLAMIRRLMSREAGEGRNPRSFLATLEWAEDMQAAFIIDLTTNLLREDRASADCKKGIR
jgi:hypothetical protein